MPRTKDYTERTSLSGGEVTHIYNPGDGTGYKTPMSAIAGLAGEVIVAASDQTLTSQTTPQDDDTLVATIAANEIITGNILVYWSQAGSGPNGWRSTISAPAGASGGYANGFFQTTLLAIGAETNNTGSGTSTYEEINTFPFVINNGATAGQVKFQWAQSSSSATESYRKAGSIMVIHRV